MPHVEEGQLHAWLDGAYPAGDRELLVIRTHLQECSDCRNRFEDARAIRERAGEILNLANPATADPPPFEQLSARRAVEPSRKTYFPGPARLAWAATVVLALGAGWLARGFMPPSQSFDAAVMVRESAESGRGGDVDGAAPAAYSTRGVQQSVPAPPPPLPSPPPQVATQVEADAGGPAAARQRQPNETRLADAVTKPSEPVAAEVTGSAGRMRAAASAEVAPPPAARAMAERPMLAVTGLTIDGPAPTEWQRSTLAEARRQYGEVLHVPELPIDNVSVARSGPSVLVRVTQQLPDRTTLELLHTIPAAETESYAAGAAPSAAAKQAPAPVLREPTSDATGAWLLTFERGNTTITARAPIRPDSLTRLVRRLQ